VLVLTVHIGEEAVQFDKETVEPTPNFSRQNIRTRLQRCHLCKETGHKVHTCPNVRFLYVSHVSSYLCSKNNTLHVRVALKHNVRSTLRLAFHDC